ncbi:uncharacterized protein LACBIDRAFT_335592 [Laccaria bicolor S238N-H82]|uniref:Predicted protein n=1 Tax=Laccaria bicolor (strain S238N-H82 / ATCC MYA-4686) TaxID=486041 RepID=B0E2S5_LACBS|nr:uncharacterized protein LACBIDRAFT_335592 [Laccaria bicolor S238N-H82]EDQ98856.1 predicted protein [Laccaria bicolor S238N-H82]|eukprot:XP_001890491.1 predicted protein [Laccaria bicolor S238N-H82]
MGLKTLLDPLIHLDTSAKNYLLASETHSVIKLLFQALLGYRMSLLFTAMPFNSSTMITKLGCKILVLSVGAFSPAPETKGCSLEGRDAIFGAMSAEECQAHITKQEHDYEKHDTMSVHPNNTEKVQWFYSLRFYGSWTRIYIQWHTPQNGIRLILDTVLRMRG